MSREHEPDTDRILAQTAALLAQRGDEQAVALLLDVRSMEFESSGLPEVDENWRETYAARLGADRPSNQARRERGIAQYPTSGRTDLRECRGTPGVARSASPARQDGGGRHVRHRAASRCTPACRTHIEFLDHVAPFETLDAAQAAVDGWVAGYNHRRPHQALDMATPASQFRPNGPTRLDTAVDARPLTQPETQPVTNAEPAESGPTATEPSEPSSISLVEVIEPPAAVEERSEGAAVEFEVRVPPSGELTMRSRVQKIGLHESMAGRTVTVWAGLGSVHVSNDGHVVRTTTCRLTTEDLRHLAMRGARSAGPAPAPSPP